jgi:hypothetical protein
MATVKAFLAAAMSEVGYVERPVNRTKFAAEAGHSDGAPWCASFVVAMARRVGLKLPSESPYTPSMADAFEQAHRFDGNPQPGALMFMDFPDAVARIQHVGIVISVRPDGQLNTVEGNTSAGPTGSQHNGGGVYRRVRPRIYAVGFGHPIFDPEPTQEDDMFTDEDRARHRRIEELLLAVNHQVVSDEGRLRRATAAAEAGKGLVERIVKKLGA